MKSEMLKIDIRGNTTDLTIKYPNAPKCIFCEDDDYEIQQIFHTEPECLPKSFIGYTCSNGHVFSVWNKS